MQALKIPKWVFHRIDRITRNFLWKGSQPCKPINCLVNWELTCALKEEGGLGIIDLQTQNEALMTKWLWLFQSNSQSNWSAVLTRLYGIRQASDIGTEAHHSFFLRDLKGMLSFYMAAVSCPVDNTDIGWILGKSGRFSMSSVYRMLHLRGISCPFQSRLWSTKAPLKVRVFIWVLIKNKLLTRAMLRRRGCQVPDGCALCGSNMLETSRHLFWECSVSQQFWVSLINLSNLDVNTIGVTNHIQLWSAVQASVNSNSRKIWKTAWAAGLWALWRERNNIIFSDKRKSFRILVADTVQEITRWLQYC